MQLAIPSSLKFMRQHVPQSGRRISAIAILILLNSLLTVLNPKLLGMYIDHVLMDQPLPFGNGALLLSLFIAVTLVSLLLGTFLIWFTEKIGWQATNSLRLELLETILGKGREFFIEHKPGEVIERVDGDAQALSEFFSKFFASILGNAMLLTVIVIFLTGIHWVFALAFLALILVTVSISILGRKWIMGFFLKERKVTSELYGTHEDLLSAREDLIGLGEIVYPIEKASAIEKSKYTASLRTQLAARLFNIVISLAVGLGSVLPFLVGVPLFARNSISVGDIFLVSFYATMVFIPTFEIVRQMDILQRAEASIARMNQILEDDQSVFVSQKPVPDKIETIEMENLSFTYRDETDFKIEGITFRFDLGKLNGIVGRTGSGKTTLLRLILRQYESYSGKIMINGKEIRMFPKEDYQSLFYWVSQTGGFFPGSIIENLTFYDNSPDLERLISLMKQFRLWNILEDVDFNLHADFKQLQLSDGQKQIFEFIRALYFDSPILILDEITSSTDTVYTHQILDHLERIKDEKLVILVAHHHETICKLENILYLEDGSHKINQKSTEEVIV
ncbi:MAG: ABC transporter ATP-binding protein [Methanobacteriota archaeon]|nr:MAG: ABC transporter ATP-binding protein [Euryarchaeota archaeon]